MNLFFIIFIILSTAWHDFTNFLTSYTIIFTEEQVCIFLQTLNKLFSKSQMQVILSSTYNLSTVE